MTTDIEKFDPSTLLEGVRDRVKATFVSLIPDEAWDKMVKNEIDDWMKTRERGYGRESYSDFSVVVRGELKTRAVEAVKKILGEFETFEWDANGRQVVHEKIKSMILENAGAVLLSVVGSMIQGSVNNLQNQINAGGSL